ncbi:MAG: 50S ribosomal protein L22 [Candidatus Paceibacterota bacterium]
MKAYLKNYRQSPRKVRLVADLIKGKNVEEAILSLDFLPKRASTPIKKLLVSAVANAKNLGKDAVSLFVKELRVDKGIVMKRMMPRAMGRGARINKRTSNIALLLSERAAKVRKVAEKTAEKKSKKVVTKAPKAKAKK